MHQKAQQTRDNSVHHLIASIISKNQNRQRTELRAASCLSLNVASGLFNLTSLLSQYISACLNSKGHTEVREKECTTRRKNTSQTEQKTEMKLKSDGTHRTTLLLLSTMQLLNSSSTTPQTTHIKLAIVR